MSAYVVFQSIKDRQGNESWQELGSVEAASPGAAILTVEPLLKGVRYATVPRRSWSPVEIEVESKVRFVGATAPVEREPDAPDPSTFE